MASKMLRMLLSHHGLQSCAMFRRADPLQRTSIYLASFKVNKDHPSLKVPQPGILAQNISHSCMHQNNSNYNKFSAKEESDVREDGSSLEEARKEVADLLAIGWQAPEMISDANLEHYLTLTSKKGRKKFLRFLFKKEMMKKTDKMKKEERAKERAKVREKEGTNEDDDAFPNRILLRVQSKTMLQFDRWRLASGMKFGPNVVYDFSYEQFMRRQEVISLVQQLGHANNANKSAKDPFHVHWVGLTDETQSLKEMKRMLGDSFENTMVSDTDKDLLEVFPKDRLIYLSADSPNVLRSFEPDKTYVIGALVDSHIICTGQSLARAKRFGIDHARLPLDKHLQWTTGAKNLTLDQMMKILLEINTSGDWVKALQHVPIRKHAGLRSGSHWEQQEVPHSGPKKRSHDSIQRNPSHFVSSRARKGDGRIMRRQTSQSRSSRSYGEGDDDTDSTLFASRPKSWFDDDK